jgi:HK97 family phage major capsid protein
MSHYNKVQPVPMTVENLRAALASGDIHQWWAEDLTAARQDAFDRVSAILERTEGRARLADEQRQYDRKKNLIDAIDRVYARMNDEHRRENDRKTRREEEAASLRRQHPYLFGDTAASPPGNGFGEAIRDAIGEVLEGRSMAYVDVPEIRTLTEGGTGGDIVPVQFKSPVYSLRARSVVMSLPGIAVEPMTSDRTRWPRFGTATVDAAAEAATLTDAATDLDYVQVVAVRNFGISLIRARGRPTPFGARQGR